MLCLNAPQPGKVSNGLNARQQDYGSCRQSEIFTEFPLKDSLKLLDDIWCFFRNVERWQNNRAYAYYKIGTDVLDTLRLHRQLEIFIELRQKASFKPNEKVRCLFGIAKRF